MGARIWYMGSSALSEQSAYTTPLSTVSGRSPDAFRYCGMQLPAEKACDLERMRPAHLVASSRRGRSSRSRDGRDKRPRRQACRPFRGPRRTAGLLISKVEKLGVSLWALSDSGTLVWAVVLDGRYVLDVQAGESISSTPVIPLLVTGRPTSSHGRSQKGKWATIDQTIKAEVQCVQ